MDLFYDSKIPNFHSFRIKLSSFSLQSMSGQKPLHFLRSTKWWSIVQTFLDDSDTQIFELPRTVSSADRDQIRQICKHFDVPFKVHGEGTEKFMVLCKPDFSYFEQVEHQTFADQMVTHTAELEHWKSLAISLAIELASGKNCGNCSQHLGDLMIKACGHIVCKDCGQNEKCKVCGSSIGELLQVARNNVSSSPKNKKIRS